MTDFYWSKACPGLYFLWDRPMQKGTGRGHVGKVWRNDAGLYHAYFNQGAISVRLPASNSSPAKKLESLEASILRLIPGATFTKEGF